MEPVEQALENMIRRAKEQLNFLREQHSDIWAEEEKLDDIYAKMELQKEGSKVFKKIKKIEKELKELGDSEFQPKRKSKK